MFPPLRAGGGWEIGQSIHTAHTSLQPHRNQPYAKNGRLSRFAKQPPNGRLDLDRLAAFCYLTKLVGLRKTKPRRQDLRARLRACRPRRHISRASPLLRRLTARFAAPAATTNRRTSGCNAAPWVHKNRPAIIARIDNMIKLGLFEPDGACSTAMMIS